MPAIVHLSKNEYSARLKNNPFRLSDSDKPMKFLLSQSIVLLGILSLFALPCALRAETTPPLQQITLSFDLDQARLQGTSSITLPPDMDLRLYLEGLEEVQIHVSPADDAGLTTLDNEQTLVLATAPHERNISITWQLTDPSGTMSGNLISTRGITLAGHWHPVADRDMLFSLTATLPDGFNGVTEADDLVLEQSKNSRILKAGYPHPLQSINFAAGPYTIQSRKVGATTVYTYFFQEDSGLSPAYLDKATDYIKRYERLIGPFPFARYSIVENRLPTGYGMPTFTLLGQAVLRLPFIKDTSLGHEILHSWFGNSLRLDGTGNWCEGLPTYLADQSYAEDSGKGSRYRKQQLMRYQSFVHPGNIMTLIDFHHGGDSGPLAQKMRAIGYDKGSMFFCMLNQEVGDRNFFKGLRQLYAENRYQKIGWIDIETTFSRVAGRDLSLFFSQWLLRNDIPELSIEDATIEQKNGKSVLSFTLKQHNNTPYRLQVPVSVQSLDGWSTTPVQVDSPDQHVSVTVDDLPEKLVLDPEYTIMRTLQPAEQYPAWMQVMGAANKILVLPAKKDMERYQPLITEFKRRGLQPVSAATLKNSELSENTMIFLGNSIHTRGVFGRIKHPAQGFTLDVRSNPLNPAYCMVLISASSEAETTAVVHKLNHYGKYSYLHFKHGRIQQKRIAPSADGIDLELLTPPVGIPVRQTQGFEQIIAELEQSRVVYIGEQHTDYSSHLLQLQVIQALDKQHKKNKKNKKNPGLIIGMEMFPRSSQQALDAYCSGAITEERDFLKASDYFKVWGFDYRLYRDIINYARGHHIPLVGLNLDKTIVSSVFRNGSTDELSREQLDRVAAERDLALPGYRERLQSIHAIHNSSPHGSNFAGFLQAQSMWDETMAESIVQALTANPGKQMVVLAGIGHVYKDSAIPPRVARRIHGNIQQSVLIADNGVDRGLERGKQIDYLMLTTSKELQPAGKIGVVLDTVDKTEDTPAQVRIVRISPHGKAGQAGLQENDIILAINDFPVSSVGDLKAGLLDKKPGETVTLKIKREQKIMRIKVELSNMDMSTMMMPPGHPGK